MNRAVRASVVCLTAVCAGCATKTDVDAVRSEIASVQAQQDSLSRTLSELDRSIAEVRALLLESRGEFGRQLGDVERQLVQIQELLGQSQIVLRNLRERIATRESELEPPGDEQARADTAGAARRGEAGAQAGAGGGAARALYSAAVEQMRRGAFRTARGGFQEFLVTYPAHELAPDAQLNLAETYREERETDRAIREYNRVVELYPNSSAAPTALYKAGLLQAERGNKDTACEYFQRVMAGYPRSDESRLASDQARQLGC